MMGRALTIAIGVVLLMPAMVSAKPKVALVAFEGDDSGQVGDVMAELLDGDYTLSGTKQVTRTIDKLGLDSPMSEKDLRKLANELEVDAIVRGDLRKKGKRKLLHVKLFVNGKKVRGFKVEFASLKSEKFKSALKDKMDEKLAGEEKRRETEEVAEEATDDEEPVGGKKKREKTDEQKLDKAERAEKAEREAKQAEEDESDDDETGDGDSDDDEDDEPKKRVARADVDDEDIDGELSAGVTVDTATSKRAANRAAIRLDIGPSVSARTLRFNSRNFEQAPKPYKNSAVGGMRVAGELYPLAFGNPNSFLAGLGIAGHYDQTLKLNLKSTAQQGTNFPVEQKHWGIGARLRIAFGRRPTSPTVTLGGGYFHRKFVVDRSALMEGNFIDLPDVFYKGFDPGIQFRIPIIKQLAFIAGGQAVLVTDTGQISKAYSYGRAKVTGGQGMAGFDVVIANRIALRMIGEIAQMGYAFTGNGELTYNRDRDPSTPDVGGASDRYYGGAATLAIIY